MLSAKYLEGLKLKSTKLRVHLLLYYKKSNFEFFKNRMKMAYIPKYEQF